MYRKNLTGSLKNLYYLDDRPVFESERIFADAWKKGGKEAEQQARQKYVEEQENKKKKHMEIERAKWDKTREQRKKMMKDMIDELKGKKSHLVEKRESLKQKYKMMLDTDPDKDKTYN